MWGSPRSTLLQNRAVAGVSAWWSGTDRAGQGAAPTTTPGPPPSVVTTAAVAPPAGTAASAPAAGPVPRPASALAGVKAVGTVSAVQRDALAAYFQGKRVLLLDRPKAELTAVLAAKDLVAAGSKVVLSEASREAIWNAATDHRFGAAMADAATAAAKRFELATGLAEKTGASVAGLGRYVAELPYVGAGLATLSMATITAAIDAAKSASDTYDAYGKRSEAIATRDRAKQDAADAAGTAKEPLLAQTTAGLLAQLNDLVSEGTWNVSVNAVKAVTGAARTAGSWATGGASEQTIGMLNTGVQAIAAAAAGVSSVADKVGVSEDVMELALDAKELVDGLLGVVNATKETKAMNDWIAGLPATAGSLAEHPLLGAYVLKDFGTSVLVWSMLSGTSKLRRSGALKQAEALTVGPDADEAWSRRGVEAASGPAAQARIAAVERLVAVASNVAKNATLYLGVPGQPPPSHVSRSSGRLDAAKEMATDSIKESVDGSLAKASWGAWLAESLWGATTFTLQAAGKAVPGSSGGAA